MKSDYSFLLNRPEHHFDDTAIDNALNGKRVLITGAGGSIGSSLVERCYVGGAHLIGCVGHSEAPIFALKNSLPKDLRFDFSVTDIGDWGGMQKLFNAWKPDLVIHAAAHKHVALMENQHREAFRNNCEATLQLAAQAIQSDTVRQFLFISTDKAAQPTCVMGASKRLAEVGLLYRHAPFVRICRFGNVLGSAGSLVEIIERKLAAGEPIKITDPQMKRFFITAREAVGLVLTAALLESDGELFTLDMGEPVSIMDIVEKLTFRKPVELDIVGAGSGEKLTEQILNPGEQFEPADSPALHKLTYIANPQFEAVLHQVRDNPSRIVTSVATL